jgi:hypothetical protein
MSCDCNNAIPEFSIYLLFETASASRYLCVFLHSPIGRSWPTVLTVTGDSGACVTTRSALPDGSCSNSYDPMCEAGDHAVASYSGYVTISEAEGRALTALESADWSEDFSDPIAFARAAEYGRTAVLQKMRWWLRHSPPMTCYLKAWISTVETIHGVSGDPTISTYEWVGSGTPCYASDNPATEPYPMASDHEIVQAEKTEVAPPAFPTDSDVGSNTIRVSILKWSFVRGYEPDISDPENPQPNGFPDPAWEPAAP